MHGVVVELHIHLSVVRFLLGFDIFVLLIDVFAVIIVVGVSILLRRISAEVGGPQGPIVWERSRWTTFSRNSRWCYVREDSSSLQQKLSKFSAQSMYRVMKWNE